MSASLVGSEMCIRDSCRPATLPPIISNPPPEHLPDIPPKSGHQGFSAQVTAEAERAVHQAHC
eukprot:9353119-Alexandrium_andersonii.AAC.2